MLHALIGFASAAEVVWLTPPDARSAARLAAAAHATGPPLTLLDLRAAATAFSARDEQALRDLDTALTAARGYEQVLDGELIILRTIEAPLAQIGILRGDEDRAGVFAALAYQGFAADRFFAADLAGAELAAPYRATLLDRVVIRPWVDAAALEPTRDASAYEIAEAPQRARYNQLREWLAEIVPATLSPAAWPAGAALVVDGRRTDGASAGQVTVRPGRHLVHAEVDGRVIGRWDVRLTPGEDRSLALTPTEAEWSAFVASGGRVVPAGVAPLIDALGGEVWLADGGRAVSVTAAGARAVEGAADRRARLTGSLGALGGWLGSGDFYLQDPSVPRTYETVNAGLVGGWAELGLRAGAAHVEAGLDALVPLGARHLALTGDGAQRLRAVPYVGVGSGPLTVAGGWLFPYHPALGAHVALPQGIWRLRAAGWIGLPATWARADGSEWTARPLFTVAIGAGVGF